MSEVTQLVEQREQGDGRAAAHRLPLVSSELRAVAAAQMARE